MSTDAELIALVAEARGRIGEIGTDATRLQDDLTRNGLPEGFRGDAVLDQMRADIDLLDRLADALEAARADGGWLPIESAPKDGTNVLLSIPALALPDDDDEAPDPNNVRVEIKPAVTVGWRNGENAAWETERDLDTNGSWFGDDWCWGDPTHWRPLPSPPASASKDDPNV